MFAWMMWALVQDELTAEKAEKLFVEAYVAYADADRDDSTKKFTKIYEKFSKDPIGAISAYNIACNLALEGESAKAADWLKKALEAGYDNFEHVESDGDLGSIREEKKYEEALAEAKKKAGKEKRAPIRDDQAKAFAERLAQAHEDGDGTALNALFSRLGWLAHEKTADGLNVELKKKKLKLENSGGGWQLVDN